MICAAPKLCFLQCYYGSWPGYWFFWASSVAANPDIQFIILTDLPPPEYVPSNIKIIKMSFAEVINRLSLVLGFRLNFYGYHKLCDARPFYGLAFQDILENFDFWGYCDMDLIFGDLAPLIAAAKTNVDVISPWDRTVGHCTLIRNSLEINRMPLQVAGHEWRFSQVESTFFDEGGYFVGCVRSGGLNFFGADSINDEWKKKKCFLGATITPNGVIWGMERIKHFAVVCESGRVFVNTLANGNHEVLYFHFMAAKPERFWRRLEGKKAFPISFVAYGFLPKVVSSQELEGLGYRIRCLASRTRSKAYSIPRGLIPKSAIVAIKKWRTIVRGIRRT